MNEELFIIRSQEKGSQERGSAHSAAEAGVWRLKTFCGVAFPWYSVPPMNRITLGIVCGLAFGLIDVLLMIPMVFPDKRVAMIGAFLDRFAIGFLVCVVDLPIPGWLTGLLVALLVSLPSAVITKAYAPILGLGAVGGVIIGIIRLRFGV